MAVSALESQGARIHYDLNVNERYDSGDPCYSVHNTYDVIYMDRRIDGSARVA